MWFRLPAQLNFAAARLAKPDGWHCDWAFISNMQCSFCALQCLESGFGSGRQTRQLIGGKATPAVGQLTDSCVPAYLQHHHLYLLTSRAPTNEGFLAWFPGRHKLHHLVGSYLKQLCLDEYLHGPARGNRRDSIRWPCRFRRHQPGRHGNGLWLPKPFDCGYGFGRYTEHRWLLPYRYLSDEYNHPDIK